MSAPDEATMSFGDHLEELRRRLLFAAGPTLPLAILLFVFGDWFIELLVQPLQRVLVDEGLPAELVVLTLPEYLIVKLKLAVIVAAVLTAPWILWQAWLFIRPGLYLAERRFVHLLVPGSAVLTTSGALLLYYLMLPLMAQVLVAIAAKDSGVASPPLDPRIAEVLADPAPVPSRTVDPSDAVPGDRWVLVPANQLRVAVAGADGAVEIVTVRPGQRTGIAQTYRLSWYINFVLLLLVAVVIAFQMPLVIVLLGWVGLVDAPWLRQRRRWALLICGILSAVLTPQDVVSMLVMLVPLYALYELGIVLLVMAPASAVAEGRVFRRRWRRRAPDKSAEQTVEPVQAEGSRPRDAGPVDPPPEDASNDADDPDRRS